MYSSKLKTKYRIISFFMSIVFVFSNIAQVLPITAFGEEPQKLNFAWILNDESDNQSIDDNGKNSVWKVKADSYVEMKANLNVSLNADTERVNITLPKSAYTNSDETSVDLDTEALGDFYDAVLNEENGTYEITPKQVIADTELNMNVVYKGQVKENAEFDINADVMQNDESVTYSVHGMTEIISEDEDSSATVENANVKNLDTDTKILDIPDVQTNINKLADNTSEPQYTVKWISDTWEFKSEQYYNFQAALHIGGLPNNTTRTFEITLPKYLYKYRDSNIGPILDVKGLKDSGFTVTDKNNGFYTVTKPDSTDQTTDFIFTYKNASLVKTQSGTEIDMPITVKISDQEDTYSGKLEGTINTSISSITPSKEYAGKVSDNGQIKEWTPALQSVYGITKAQFDATCDDPAKEYRFSEYCITADVIGCQPYTISINENPTDGEVIAVTDGSKMLTAAGTDGYYSFDKIYNKEDPNYNESPKIYALVRYTTDKNTTRKLHNTVNVKATGIDDTNKSVEKDAQITHQWAVANVDYDKGVWGIAKGYSRSNISGAIDILKNKGEKQFFYQAIGYANTARYLSNDDKERTIFDAYNSYNGTKPTYRIEVMDDAMFIGKKDGTFEQLGASDYEFKTCRVYLSVNKMKKVNGEYVWNENTGKPELEPPINAEYPYINIGDYLDKITVNDISIDGKEVKTDKNGEKYVEVKLPEGTTTVKAVFTEEELGENRLRLDLYGQWKGSGSTFTKYHDDIFGKDSDNKDSDNIKSIPVINWDAIHGYQETGAEFYADFNGNSKFGRENGSWQNPVSETCWYNSDTKKQMLEFDKKYDGHGEIYDNVIVPEGSGDDSTDVEGYSQRSVITHNIYKTPAYGGAAKWGSNRIEPTDGKDSDGKAAATMSYNLIAMYGGLTGFSSDLDQLIYKEVMTSTKKAVFYDLLPKGMEYQSIEPLTGTQTVDTNVNGQFTWDFKDITGGEYKFIPDANGMKTVYSLQKYQNASVDVQDNYNDSGRQLLKITVNYTNPPKAYFSGYKTSLWSLFFSAKINVRATDKSGKFNKTNYQNYVAAKFYDNENKPIEINDTPVKTSMCGDTGAFPKLGEKGIAEPITDNDGKQTVVHAQAISRGNQNADATNIFKSIKADHYDDAWKDSTYTDLGGTYQYRLLYNINKGKSTNVVIFDTIEFAGTDWHGELQDISVELPKGLQDKSNNIEIYYKEGNYTPTDTNNDKVINQADIDAFLSGFTELHKSNDPKNLNQNYEIPDANKKSITIAVKFNDITFNADDDNDYAAVYLKMKATNEWANRTKKAYNDVSYYDVLDATGVGSLQTGNVVNIGLRGIEKTFSLTKKFVDGVGGKIGNDPKSYFGNVNFKLECTKVDYELDEYDKSKDLKIIEKETKTAEGTTQTDLVSDFDYTMPFNGETTQTAVDFAKARFTKAGKYTFEVTELEGDDTTHVTYDTNTKYTVEVTVERDTDPSKFKITKTEIKKDGTLVTDDDIEFENRVKKEPETYPIATPIKFTKKFEGDISASKQFIIRVTCDDNSVGTLYKTGNSQIGEYNNYGATITVSRKERQNSVYQAQYTQPGVYTYYVSEVSSQTDVYEYDPSIYKVDIYIKKSADGNNLEFEKEVITKIRNSDGIDIEKPTSETINEISGINFDKITFTNTNSTSTGTKAPTYTLNINKTFWGNNAYDDFNGRTGKKLWFYYIIDYADTFSMNTITNGSGSSNSSAGVTKSDTKIDSNKWSYSATKGINFSFKKPGIYRYTITEDNTKYSLNGSYVTSTSIDGKPITFDKSEYWLTVPVTENPDHTLTVGNFKLEKVKDKDGNELASPTTVSTADFENTLAVAELTPPTIKKYVETLYKDKEFNQGLISGDYHFNIKLTSANANDCSLSGKDIYVHVDSDKAFGSNNFPNIKFWNEGNFVFEIEELPFNPDKTQDRDCIIDERVYIWTVNITKDDSTGKYVVNEMVKLKDGDESDYTYNKNDNSISFENKFINKGTFEPRIKKILKGLNSAIDDEEIPTEYTFKITAVTENAPMPEKRQVTVNLGELNSDSVTGEASFGVINFNGLPDYNDYVYEIEEIKPNDDKSHVQYDTKKYKLTIRVNGNDIYTAKIDNNNRSIRPNCYYDFEFTNTLHDDENGHNAEISFTKYIEGDDPKLTETNSKGEIIGRDFTFKLEPIDNAPEPNDGSDEYTLTFKKKETEILDSTAVKFTNQTGTYRYKFYEVKENIPQYAYDSKVYIIEVDVSHGYVDSVKYYLDGREVDKIEFTNTYLDPQYIPTGINTNSALWFCTLMTIGGAMALMLKKRTADE